MKPLKPSRSVFLRAAELQFDNANGADHNSTSTYACDNIGHARTEAGLGVLYCGTVDHDFFSDHFRPHGLCFAWWPDLPNGNHDHESRILALLLCAEMLRR